LREYVICTERQVKDPDGAAGMRQENQWKKKKKN
jgi:hypothetical protein